MKLPLHIAQIRLYYILRSKTPYIIFMIGIFFSLLASWDEQGQQIRILGIDLNSNTIISTGRVKSLSLYFYGFYSYSWVFLFLIYVPRKVIFPLIDSFSVSQTLWLRLTPVSSVNLALSRLLVILGTSIFLFILSTIWAIIHAFIHNIALQDLMLPIYGLIGHLFMSCGIVILFGKNHQIARNSRMAISVTALLIPPLLYSMSDKIINSLNGFFPYAAPFIVEEINILAYRPFITAIFTGLLLFFLYILPIFIGQSSLHQRKY